MPKSGERQFDSVDLKYVTGARLKPPPGIEPAASAFGDTSPSLGAITEYLAEPAVGVTLSPGWGASPRLHRMMYFVSRGDNPESAGRSATRCKMRWREIRDRRSAPSPTRAREIHRTGVGLGRAVHPLLAAGTKISLYPRGLCALQGAPSPS
jgi:hypothetical protein